MQFRRNIVLHYFLETEPIVPYRRATICISHGAIQPIVIALPLLSARRTSAGDTFYQLVAIAVPTLGNSSFCLPFFHPARDGTFGPPPSFR